MFICCCCCCLFLFVCYIRILTRSRWAHIKIDMAFFTHYFHPCPNVKRFLFSEFLFTSYSCSFFHRIVLFFWLEALILFHFSVTLSCSINVNTCVNVYVLYCVCTSAIKIERIFSWDGCVIWFFFCCSDCRYRIDKKWDKVVKKRRRDGEKPK